MTGEMFRVLLEAAPDAIVAVDTSGRILFANAQVEALFGYRREELVGEFVERLVPDAGRARHQRHREQYVADPVPRPMGAGLQLAGRRKDGSEFPVDISLSGLSTSDGLLVSAVIRDVSDRIAAQAERDRLMAEAERKRFEARLGQSQRLESLGQLAGGVAHDFNNLLAVILNYATFIHERVEEAAVDDSRWGSVRDDVEQVQRAAERAVELTRQLLAFGRREVVHPRPLLINDVVREVEPLLRRTLSEHVDLDIDTNEEISPILADPGQVEQVLVNLAVNARDAMAATGGHLRVDTADVDVDEAYAASRPGLIPGSYVRLRVSDTGPGMLPEVVERAFEPFFTTKPKGEGTGLGLATVYGIVTQAGGHAQLYSEAGIGTTFSALFPAISSAPEVRPAPVGAAPHRGAETVVVVEDEDGLREVTRRLLARNGYVPLIASSGPDAIRIVEQHPGPIDLLLTDVVMPMMLGKEVAERITALRPGVRVLYMSGYAQPVLASQGTLEPGVALLEKPFSEVGLVSKVRAVLDQLVPTRD